MANINRLAGQFVVLWKAEQAAKKDRKGVAVKLQEYLHRSHLETVQVGADLVVLETSSRKCPTRDDLARAFGKVAAETFWKKLPAAVSTYVTVKPAKVKATA